MNLSDLPPHTRAVVTEIDATGSLALRYRELGLRAGAGVEVTQLAAFGGRVVALGADRFALDRVTCRRINVQMAG